MSVEKKGLAASFRSLTRDLCNRIALSFRTTFPANGVFDMVPCSVWLKEYVEQPLLAAGVNPSTAWRTVLEDVHDRSGRKVDLSSVYGAAWKTWSEAFVAIVGLFELEYGCLYIEQCSYLSAYITDDPGSIMWFLVAFLSTTYQVGLLVKDLSPHLLHTLLPKRIRRYLYQSRINKSGTLDAMPELIDMVCLVADREGYSRFFDGSGPLQIGCPFVPGFPDAATKFNNLYADNLPLPEFPNPKVAQPAQPAAAAAGLSVSSALAQRMLGLSPSKGTQNKDKGNGSTACTHVGDSLSTGANQQSTVARAELAERMFKMMLSADTQSKTNAKKSEVTATMATGKTATRSPPPAKPSTSQTSMAKSSSGTKAQPASASKSSAAKSPAAKTRVAAKGRKAAKGTVKLAKTKPTPSAAKGKRSSAEASRSQPTTATKLSSASVESTAETAKNSMVSAAKDTSHVSARPSVAANGKARKAKVFDAARLADPTPSGTSNSRWCELHHTHSHNTDECLLKKNRNDSGTRGRGRGRNGVPPMWCAYHGSPTHSTSDCYDLQKSTGLFESDTERKTDTSPRAKHQNNVYHMSEEEMDNLHDSLQEGYRAKHNPRRLGARSAYACPEYDIVIGRKDDGGYPRAVSISKEIPAVVGSEVFLVRVSDNVNCNYIHPEMARSAGFNILPCKGTAAVAASRGKELERIGICVVYLRNDYGERKPFVCQVVKDYPTSGVIIMKHIFESPWP